MSLNCSTNDYQYYGCHFGICEPPKSVAFLGSRNSRFIVTLCYNQGLLLRPIDLTTTFYLSRRIPFEVHSMPCREMFCRWSTGSKIKCAVVITFLAMITRPTLPPIPKHAHILKISQMLRDMRRTPTKVCSPPL